jgi:hypothetical protein
MTYVSAVPSADEGWSSRHAKASKRNYSPPDGRRFAPCQKHRRARRALRLPGAFRGAGADPVVTSDSDKEQNRGQTTVSRTNGFARSDAKSVHELVSRGSSWGRESWGGRQKGPVIRSEP